MKLTAGEAKPRVVGFDFTKLDPLDLWNAERQTRVEKSTRAAARSPVLVEVGSTWGAFVVRC